MIESAIILNVMLKFLFTGRVFEFNKLVVEIKTYCVCAEDGLVILHWFVKVYMLCGRVARF